MTELDNLIRQAVAAEADERVDPRTVLAELQRRRSRRPLGAMITVGIAVAAIVVAVVVLIPRTSPTANTAAPPASGQTVLLMGLDERSNTDAIVLARVGANGSFNAVSVPRDTVVDGQRINSYYPQGGPQALVAKVEQLTGTKIDHYAAVEMASFGKVAEALGGVVVCLSGPARDAFSGTDLPAGRQMLSGAQALAFLRQRHGLPNGDLDRVARQQAFLGAVVAKIGRNPDKAAELFKAVSPHIRTDEGWDVLQFAGQMAPSGIVRTATIPVGEHDASSSGLQVDPAAVREFVTKFLVESPPTQGSGQSGTPSCVS